MKLHTKTALIIIGTLLIGFVLGFTSNIFFLKSRFDKVKDFHRRGKMTNFFVEKLDLTDQQKELAEPIIDKYNVRFHKHGEEMRDKIEGLVDSLRTELKPILTEEQMKQLNKRYRRFTPFMRKPPRP